LRELWSVNRFLKEHKIHRDRPEGTAELAFLGRDWQHEFLPPQVYGPMAEVIAENYKEFGYRFVPLAREDISLLCSLSILFLRRDPPGSALHARDIDNRLKTIIDALRKPKNATELVGHEKPGKDEDPFFVLLEDDKQVSHLDVETDTLLDPSTDGREDRSRARLIITVELRPYEINLFNLSFA